MFRAAHRSSSRAQHLTTAGHHMCI